VEPSILGEDEEPLDAGGATSAAGPRVQSASQKARMVREFVLMTGSRYLGAVLGVVRGLVIPRLLDPAVYGVFKTYGTFSELSRVATLGVPSALFRELPIAKMRGETNRVARLLDNGFWSTVLSAVPFAIAMTIGGAAGWIRLKDVHVTVWYLIFVPLLFVDRTKVFFDIVLTGQKQFMTQAKIRMFDEVLTTILCVGGVWAGGFPGLLAANLAANVAVTALAWVGTGFRIRGAMDTTLATEMMGVGFPQLVNGLCSTVYNQLDRMVILGGGLGLRAVGFYSVGMTINDQLVGVAQIISRVLMPRMMEQYGHREDVRDIAQFVIPPARLSGLGYAGLMGLAAIFGEIVFRVLLPKYESGLLPFQIMLAGTFFLSIWASVSPFFLAVKQQSKILWVFLATIPIALALNLGAVALHLELPGVAFATSLTDFGFATCVLLQALAAFHPRPADRMKELGRIYSPFPIAGVVLVAAWWLRDRVGWADDPLRGPLLAAAVFVLLFVLPAIAFARSAAGRRYLSQDSQ
jgi:O-antigen/teichoic acid export membrane protein